MTPGGRPRQGLPETEAVVTKQVRLLVNEAHGGNVHEASNVTGVPAATLRALYNGRSANPGLNTLKALGEPYGLMPGWFSGEEPSRHPRMGIDITFRDKLRKGTYEDYRYLGIPWAAWPMPGVFSRLLAHVVSLPGPVRPLIGELDPTDPTDFIDMKAAVAKFLFAPLIAEEDAFGGLLIPDSSHDNRDEAKLNRLRLLGLFWQDALTGVWSSERTGDEK